MEDYKKSKKFVSSVITELLRGKDMALVRTMARHENHRRRLERKITDMQVEVDAAHDAEHRAKDESEEYDKTVVMLNRALVTRVDKEVTRDMQLEAARRKEAHSTIAQRHQQQRQVEVEELRRKLRTMEHEVDARRTSEGALQANVATLRRALEMLLAKAENVMDMKGAQAVEQLIQDAEMDLSQVKEFAEDDKLRTMANERQKDLQEMSKFRKEFEKVKLEKKTMEQALRKAEQDVVQMRLRLMERDSAMAMAGKRVKAFEVKLEDEMNSAARRVAEAEKHAVDVARSYEEKLADANVKIADKERELLERQRMVDHFRAQAQEEKSKLTRVVKDLEKAQAEAEKSLRTELERTKTQKEKLSTELQTQTQSLNMRIQQVETEALQHKNSGFALSDQLKDALSRLADAKAAVSRQEERHGSLESLVDELSSKCDTSESALRDARKTIDKLEREHEAQMNRLEEVAYQNMDLTQKLQTANAEQQRLNEGLVDAARTATVQDVNARTPSKGKRGGKGGASPSATPQQRSLTSPDAAAATSGTSTPQGSLTPRALATSMSGVPGGSSFMTAPDPSESINDSAMASPDLGASVRRGKGRGGAASLAGSLRASANPAERIEDMVVPVPKLSPRSERVLRYQSTLADALAIAAKPNDTAAQLALEALQKKMTAITEWRLSDPRAAHKVIARRIDEALKELTSAIVQAAQQRVSRASTSSAGKPGPLDAQALAGTTSPAAQPLAAGGSDSGVLSPSSSTKVKPKRSSLKSPGKAAGAESSPKTAAGAATEDEEEDETDDADAVMKAALAAAADKSLETPPPKPPPQMASRGVQAELAPPDGDDAKKRAAPTAGGGGGSSLKAARAGKTRPAPKPATKPPAPAATPAVVAPPAPAVAATSTAEEQSETTADPAPAAAPATAARKPATATGAASSALAAKLQSRLDEKKQQQHRQHDDDAAKPPPTSEDSKPTGAPAAAVAKESDVDSSSAAAASSRAEKRASLTRVTSPVVDSAMIAARLEFADAVSSVTAAEAAARLALTARCTKAVWDTFARFRNTIASVVAAQTDTTVVLPRLSRAAADDGAGDGAAAPGGGSTAPPSPRRSDEPAPVTLRTAEQSEAAHAAAAHTETMQLQSTLAMLTELIDGSERDADLRESVGDVARRLSSLLASAEMKLASSRPSTVAEGKGSRSGRRRQNNNTSDTYEQPSAAPLAQSRSSATSSRQKPRNLRPWERDSAKDTNPAAAEQEVERRPSPAAVIPSPSTVEVAAITGVTGSTVLGASMAREDAFDFKPPVRLSPVDSESGRASLNSSTGVSGGNASFGRSSRAQADPSATLLTMVLQSVGAFLREAGALSEDIDAAEFFASGEAAAAAAAQREEQQKQSQQHQTTSPSPSTSPTPKTSMRASPSGGLSGSLRMGRTSPTSPNGRLSPVSPLAGRGGAPPGVTADQVGRRLTDILGKLRTAADGQRSKAQELVVQLAEAKDASDAAAIQGLGKLTGESRVSQARAKRKRLAALLRHSKRAAGDDVDSSSVSSSSSSMVPSDFDDDEQVQQEQHHHHNHHHRTSTWTAHGTRLMEAGTDAQHDVWDPRKIERLASDYVSASAANDVLNKEVEELMNFIENEPELARIADAVENARQQVPDVKMYDPDAAAGPDERSTSAQFRTRAQAVEHVLRHVKDRVSQLELQQLFEQDVRGATTLALAAKATEPARAVDAPAILAETRHHSLRAILTSLAGQLQAGEEAESLMSAAFDAFPRAVVMNAAATGCSPQATYSLVEQLAGWWNQWRPQLEQVRSTDLDVRKRTLERMLVLCDRLETVAVSSMVEFASAVDPREGQQQTSAAAPAGAAAVDADASLAAAVIDGVSPIPKRATGDAGAADGREDGAAAPRQATADRSGLRAVLARGTVAPPEDESSAWLAVDNDDDPAVDALFPPPSAPTKDDVVAAHLHEVATAKRQALLDELGDPSLAYTPGALTLAEGGGGARGRSRANRKPGASPAALTQGFSLAHPRDLRSGLGSRGSLRSGQGYRPPRTAAAAGSESFSEFVAGRKSLPPLPVRSELMATASTPPPSGVAARDNNGSVGLPPVATTPPPGGRAQATLLGVDVRPKSRPVAVDSPVEGHHHQPSAHPEAVTSPPSSPSFMASEESALHRPGTKVVVHRMTTPLQQPPPTAATGVRNRRPPLPAAATMATKASLAARTPSRTVGRSSASAGPMDDGTGRHWNTAARPPVVSKRH